MRGLPKIRRKGDEQAASEQPTEGPPPVSPDDQATVAYDSPLVAPQGEQATAQQPAVAGIPPADMDPAAMQVATAPSFRDRGRLRRRLAYLRRVRELGFRDLGGLVFDLHRFGRSGQQLVEAKLNALGIVDRELRALERVLKDKPLYMDLREPGIAACPRCAALHGSDARFCPSCGIKLSGPLGIGEVGGVAPPPPPPTPAVAAAEPAQDAGGVSAADYGSTPVSAGPVAPEPPVAEPEPEAPPAEPVPEPAAEPEPEPEPAAEAEPEPAAEVPEPEPAAEEPEAAAEEPEPEAAEPEAEPEPAEPEAEPEPADEPESWTPSERKRRGEPDEPES